MASNGIGRIAALDEPLRRRIFELVRRARRALTRDDVAVELGISRKLAAFHLDKLLARGLLRTHYARPPGRSGPGAGRSAKFYEPSDVDVEVTIPKRRYDLAGSLLVEAVRSEAPGERARDAALRVANQHGIALGQEVRRARKLRSLGPERALAIAEEVLEEHGYEPYRDDRRVLALRNCPFHSLAQQARDLMCSMNQAFIDGLLRGLGNDTVEAVLECKPGDCCVTLRAPAARG
jgi:predicted ArsR family transcriptional regulator